MAYTKYSLTPANNNATPPDGAPEGMLPSAVNDTMRDMMAQIRDVGDGIRGGTYTMTAPVITGGSITGVALSGNTLTNPVITGGNISSTTFSSGTITGSSLTGNTMSSGAITGGTITGVTLTGNTFTNPVITGGSINNTPIGASTANTGAFTTLSATGATTFSGATVVSGSLTANTFSSSGATITGGSINSTAIGGTTAAAGKFTTLEATGVTTVQAGTVSAPAITTSGDTNTGIYFPAADTIAFTEGGVEAMRINSSGNVGIGVTPTARLSVSDGTSALLNINPTSTTVIISSRNQTDSGYVSAIYDATQHVWRYAGVEGMRITSAGNVGIGTSSPYTVLDVRGAAGLKVYHTGGTDLNSAGSIALGDGNRSDNYVGLYRGTSISTGTASNALSLGAFEAIRFCVSATTLGSQTERMRIDSSGNVGIGNTNTSGWLYGGLSVGSGATNTAITVYSSASSEGLLLFADGTTGADRYTGYILYSHASNFMSFATNNAVERMRIDSSGNLLVGITSARANAGDVQVSKGISFPATQSAQSDANTLDDYEEGTWDPIFVPASGAFGAIIWDTQRAATYTKIGNRVFISGAIRTDAITVDTASGAVSLGGLPFTPANATNANSVLSIGISEAFAGDMPSSGRILGNSTSMPLFYRTSANGATIALDVSDLGTSTNANFITFSGFYYV